MAERNVLVAGAGIAGPTLAYWLLQYGYTPTLVERAPAPRTAGYMIDFWGVGYEVAERMGLLPLLMQDGYHLKEVRIVNTAGRRVAGFDAALFSAASGGRFFSILRGDLARRLYRSVEGKVETIFGDSVSGIREEGDGVAVTFERARSRRFDLVVGADGLHSAVRRLAWGPDQGEHFLGYYVAAFSVEGYPHRDEDIYVSFSDPGLQAARYALRDGRSAFLLIFTCDALLPVQHHEIELQKHLLQRRFRGAGWECDEMLSAMWRSDDFYFDSVTQVRLGDWWRGRVVLVGDAGYCPSLLAGEGSSFAMAGGYLLARALSLSNGDYPAACAAYQRRFKPFVDTKQRAAERLGGWFAPRTGLGVWLRNAATNLMGIPVVGERFAARMLGDRFSLDTATV